MLKEKQTILKSMQSSNSNSQINNNQTKPNPAKTTNQNNNGPSLTGAAFNELVVNENQTSKQGQANMEKQYYSMIFWAKDDLPLSAAAIRKHR